MNKLIKNCLRLVVLLVPIYSYAFSAFVVKNIQVMGLQRIEIGSVFSYLPIKVGDTVDDDTSHEIIKKLYATGLFRDVRLEANGNTLIIEVLERPVISEITVTGDHAFDHDNLIKALRDNGLTDGKIFDQGVLDQAVIALKTEYYNRGLYSVVITPKAVPLARNRVSINISIDEGKVAKIKSVTFVGNRAFSEAELQSQMFLNSGNLLSWWFKDNQYSSDKLSGDIEKVRTFYLNQGYINFKINSVQVQLSTDKKWVYVTINIAEHSQYTIDKIRLDGETQNVSKSDLEKLVTIERGKVVDQSELNAVIKNIKTMLGNHGYAFASVNPIADLDQKNHTVSYTLVIDTDKRVYVRKVNISGNDKTRDIVVRREIRQPEDALYSESAIARSKDRIALLGFFKNTDVTTEPVPGTSDQVDMDVKVDEQDSTGTMNFGLGYAQGQGLLVSASISQGNLFGSGKSSTLSASTSQLTKSVALSFTDPYYLINGTSLGYDIYGSQYTPNVINISPYQDQTLGFKVRSGVPVSEFDKIKFSAGLENNQISLQGENVPQRFIQFTNTYGGTVNTVPVSFGWDRNTTDDFYWPTRGALFSEVFDATAPGIGAEYYRFTSKNNWYVPLSKSFTWKINVQAGFINAYNGTTVPFYQNYYAGGITSLPGFYINTLGPKDTDGSSLGGTREAILDNEILFPVPGLKDSRAVRLSVFYDMGSLWGGNAFALTPQQSFRSSTGVGFAWASPLGIIRLSYAYPLVVQPNDSIERWQFMLGTSF